MNTKVKIVTDKSMKANKAEQHLQKEITDLENMGHEIKDIKYVVSQHVAQFLIIYQQDYLIMRQDPAKLYKPFQFLHTKYCAY